MKIPFATQFKIGEIVKVSGCWPEWYGRVKEIKHEIFYVVEPTKDFLSHPLAREPWNEVSELDLTKLKETQ